MSMEIPQPKRNERGRTPNEESYRDMCDGEEWASVCSLEFRDEKRGKGSRKSGSDV